MNLEKHIDAAAQIYKGTYNKLDKWQRAKTAEGEEVKKRSYKLTKEAANEENDAYVAKYNVQLETIISQHKEELEKVKNAYLQEVADFYRANGAAIDSDDVALLDSGIITTIEFEEMVVKHAENTTMLRIMDKYISKYSPELETRIRAVLFNANKMGEKEKNILKTFERLMDAAIQMAQQGYAGTETFMNTALRADEYVENAKYSLLKSKLYVSEDNMKRIKEYKDAENKRQDERNKDLDHFN